VGGTGYPAPFCRCGWTLLRTEDSADELLITPAPVQPVTTTFGPALRPGARSVKLATLIGEPPIAKPAAFGKALDAGLSRLGKDGGRATRSALRDLIESDGLISKDVHRKLSGAGKIEKLPGRVGASHDWNGAIGADDVTLARAQRASKALAKGEPLSNDDVAGLQSLIHEELHGTSVITKEAYTGKIRTASSLGMALEESTTELLAREYTERLAGLAVGDVYRDEIRGLVAQVRKATGDSEVDAIKRVNSTTKALRARTVKAETADRHLELWLENFDGPGKALDTLRSGLSTEKWWEPEVAAEAERSARKAATASKRRLKAAEKAAAKAEARRLAKEAKEAAKAEAKRNKIIAAAQKKEAAANAKADKALYAPLPQAGKPAQRVFNGIDEAELSFLRDGYRPKLVIYDGAPKGDVNAIATGRANPPGSSKPLPPIAIDVEPTDRGLLYTLRDGRHRMEAAQNAGATHIRAKIRVYGPRGGLKWEGERIIPVPKPDPKNPHGRR
jgi:hypothetical protein